MAQPTWLTSEGSLGTIPENRFFQTNLLASTPVLSNTPTVTASSASNNRFTCSSTTGVYPGLNVMFTGTTFGGVDTTTRYFVFAVYGNNEFSICETEFSTSPIALTTAAGSMTAEFAQHVYYTMLAGNLPPGIQVGDNGLITGVPLAVASLQGVPQEVSRNIVSRFAIRAYTKKPQGSVMVLDQLADRTFSLTVTGQNIPDFVTPAGNIGTYYDGTQASIQLLFTDPDPGDNIIVSIASGELPPGLTITSTGLIAGVIEPLVGPPGTAPAGYDATPKDEYPNDFTTRSTSKNFQFTVEISDGKDSNLRTFEIFVYSKDSMTADTTDFTADNTWITADVVPTRTPVLLTQPGNLGRIRSNNWYYFQFQSIDFDGDAVNYEVSTGLSTSPPPGLTLDPETGWLFGYLSQQGAREVSYQFTVTVYKRDYPDIRSNPATFTMSVIGNVDTDVTWLNGPDLGTIDNGAISTFEVSAINTGGRSLEYRLVPGSNSKLPQGLSLLPSGHIVGRVSFNTFALDGGTTTFDVERRTRLDPDPTTFDMKFEFDVNAFATQATQLSYRVSNILVANGGSGYSYFNLPTITIAPPPPGAGSAQATVGSITITAGAITAVTLANPGAGYQGTPAVFISGGSGAGAVLAAQIQTFSSQSDVDVVRRFTITVNRAFNTPYQSLYIKCMPPQSSRDLITQLIQSQSIIPNEVVYRPDDPNFGIAKNVIYQHALGLDPVALSTYVESLSLNHYWRNITLGEIRTAQALDSLGNVVYEVVYSAIIDDLLNNEGVSVGKSVKLPYPVVLDDGTVTVVYPNSLPNMRDQVIDTVGQMTPALPLWMKSKQPNGSYPGFTPAWVIAYVNPGESGRIAYNINEQYGVQLNKVDFKIDRYELDRSQTHNWDSQTDNWIPSPPESTTFDIDAHYQLPEPNDSSFVFVGGTGYQVNDEILILGSQIGGQDVVNNVTITVVSVDESGTILTARAQGTAPILTVGDTYTNISGTNIVGTGIGATWDLITVGEDPTVFDGGATTFIAPADRWTNTDSFDKYLLFPKQTILG